MEDRSTTRSPSARNARFALAALAFAPFTSATALAQDAPPPPVSPSVRTSIEAGLSSEALSLAFRAPIDDDDSLRIEGLLDDDDDWAAGARWQHRLVTFSGDVPLSLSLGLAADAVFFDRPDAEAYAVAAAGSAEVPFRTEYPTRATLDVAVAPDVTTFDDGEGLTDVALRFECDVTPRTTAWLGYRELEVDFERGGDEELDGHLGVGVRFTL